MATVTLDSFLLCPDPRVKIEWIGSQPEGTSVGTANCDSWPSGTVLMDLCCTQLPSRRAIGVTPHTKRGEIEQLPRNSQASRNSHEQNPLEEVGARN